MESPSQESRDLRFYLRLVWKRKWLLLAVVVLIPAVVYGISKALPKSYEATNTLQVQQTSVPSVLFSGGSSTDSLEGTARLIETTAVARQAARRMGLPPSAAGELLGKISVSAQSTLGGTNEQFLTITASDSRPVRAARIANAFAAGVSDERLKASIQDINRTIRLLSLQTSGEEGSAATRNQLEDQLAQLRALRAAQETATKVIEPATAPSDPASPRPLRNTAVAFVLALLVAAALVPMIEQLDRRLRAPDELDELLDADTLATIPEEAFKGKRDAPSVREAFQTLRATLTYFNVDRKLDTVMVTSAIHAEGKTTVTTNLALAMAEDGRDIILVDGDLRHPSVTERLGTGPSWGLDSVLLEDRDVDEAFLDLEVEGKGRLRLLPAGGGAPNPAVLFGSERMQKLLDELSERAELVIIDTPPILTVSDAIPLLERVSGVVLVARMDYSTRDAVVRVAEVITAARGTLLGLVATGTQVGGLYGHYAYYLPQDGERKRSPLGRLRERLRRKGAKQPTPSEEMAGPTEPTQVAAGEPTPVPEAAEAAANGAQGTSGTNGDEAAEAESEPARS